MLGMADLRKRERLRLAEDIARTSREGVWRDADVKPGVLSKTEADHFARRLFSAAEQHLQALLADHSVLYWVCLSRYAHAYRAELCARAATEDGPRTEDGSDLLTRLDLEVGITLEGALHKYGRHDASDLTVSTNEGRRLLQPLSRPKARDFGRLFAATQLCFVMHAGAKHALQRIATGYEVSVDLDAYTVITAETSDDELRTLSTRHAQRTYEYSKAGSMYGALLHPEPTRAWPDADLAIFTYVVNRERGKTVELEGENAIVPPFLFASLDLQQLFNYAVRFEGLFLKHYGVSPVEYFCTWAGVHHVVREQALADPRVLQEPQLHGYTVVAGREDFEARVGGHAATLAGALGKPMRNAERVSVRRLLRDVMTPERAAIDLRFPFKRPLVQYSTSGNVVLDLTEGGLRWQSVLEAIEVGEGKYGHAKGKALEVAVADVVKQLCPEAEMWAGTGSNIHFADGSEGEFDLGVIRGDVLLIGEVKAYSVNWENYYFYRAALRRRTDRLHRATDRLQTHAESLASHPTGLNVVIPDQVRWLVPFVCTAFPEWIPSLDPSMWLSADVPRWCTPTELGRLVSQPDLAGTLATRPFAIPVQRGEQ